MKCAKKRGREILLVLKVRSSTGGIYRSRSEIVLVKGLTVKRTTCREVTPVVGDMNVEPLPPPVPKMNCSLVMVKGVGPLPYPMTR